MIGNRGLFAPAAGLVLVLTTGFFAVQDAVGRDEGSLARSALTVIAPAAAGGGWDLAAREFQQATRTESIVNSVQVVNVPGAGGTIGLGQLQQLEADPTTVMITGAAMVGGVEMGGSSARLSDVTPIARLTDDYEVIAVPAHSPWETLDDFLDDWRENPDIPVGGGSAGSPDHLVAGQLAEAAELDPSELHYTPHAGGGELTLSLLSDAHGTVQIGVSGFNDFRDLIEGDRLRALAVVAPERLEGVDVPTTSELGYPSVDLVNWRGVVAAPGVSDEEQAELLEITEEMYQAQTWQDAIERNRWEPSWAGPEEFAGFLSEEETRIRTLMVDLGLIDEA
ncbi:tripartite tricarboxylate transporter substrate binding protein [Nocardiopsis sp. L17-MgMaSL7]|uniref:Bug family tripartite tricarboxylate transporter substrate binding protein n=1 Tax=Nocardiopsis sp. L17-MgMaSL7 TaxID=1938893 RepID=UPI000D808829|nr:tripartite tricarboxylate transporter substrate-binding protein [Nocardiopsis sp. L17-MgMaSL7]PWV49370.1 putative tricarboxylic transport membrane protein [Nocardiopsis sp. L17-MgMaSL7]